MVVREREQWGGAERNLIEIEFLLVEQLFANRRREARILSYFSGHGPSQAQKSVNNSQILPFFSDFFQVFLFSLSCSFPSHTYMMSFSSTIVGSYLVRCLQTAPRWQAYVVVFFLVTGALYSTVSLLGCVRALLSIFVLPGKSVL
jgi:hypothetical protein